MKENTNRAIAGNALILYVKMGVNTICALFTTRFALQALGVVDFGLYSVLGGIISLISIFNVIMLSVSNRYIAVAIGKGYSAEINKQFNVNLSIHAAIAFLTLLIAYPIGDWYIHHYINYEGNIQNAVMVFSISIIGSIISFIGVPYNGVLMAKERFIVFSLVDVISHIIRLVVTYLLLSHFEHKLIIYAVTLAAMTALPTLVYIIYCYANYKDIVTLRRVHDKQLYKEVFEFSSWVAIGAVATVARSQGASLIVNAFFNTVMNAAMGIANTINGYIALFAQNLTQPMEPQISKSYAAGNHSRTDELLIMSTKFAFLMTLLVGSVFLVCPEWLLSLWLGNVPPYATIFLVLFIIDNLVQSLNAGIKNIIFACGKIWLFQIVSTMLNLLSITLGYFVLKQGADAYYLIIAYICVSIIRFFLIQWVLYRTLHYDSNNLWRKSYAPSLLVILLFIPVLLIHTTLHPIVQISYSTVYLVILEFFIGLNKFERERFIKFIYNSIHRS